MGLIWEIVISALLVISGVFGLVGALGLVKLPDPMTRLHAPTKASTLGVGGALLASMLHFWAVRGVFTFHEMLITIFLFLTAPVTGHFIAKAHLHWNMRQQDLSRATGDVDWATYGDSAAEADNPTGATTEGKLGKTGDPRLTVPAVPPMLRDPD